MYSVKSNRIDVYDLADDSRYPIKPSKIFDMLKSFEGKYKNVQTGWIGECKINPPYFEDVTGAIVFEIAYIATDGVSDTEYIYLYPEKSGRRSCIMYMGTGIPDFTNSLSELQRILTKEFAGMKKIS